MIGNLVIWSSANEWLLLFMLNFWFYVIGSFLSTHSLSRQLTSLLSLNAFMYGVNGDAACVAFSWLREYKDPVDGAS